LKIAKLYCGRYKTAWGSDKDWIGFYDLTLQEVSKRINRRWEAVRLRIKAYSPDRCITFNGRPKTGRSEAIEPVLLEIYEIK